MIRLAVVTPSFNQGAFLERAMRSVLDQGYPNLEYVVCDSCSADQSAEVLGRYSDRVRAMIERDRGQADAVNKGITATSGDVIGWLNSDDTYRPGALPTVAAYFNQYPDVDVMYGDANLIDADDQIVGRYYTEPWNAARLPHRPFMCQPAVFFRRRMVDRFGLLDPTLQYTLDYEYWLRLARGGARFVYLPFTLASARVHAETKTNTQGTRLFEELNDMLPRYLDKIPDEWILTHTHAILRGRPGSTAVPWTLRSRSFRFPSASRDN